MEERIKELTLLLLYLTSWEEKNILVEMRRSWKGYDFDILKNRIFFVRKPFQIRISNRKGYKRSEKTSSKVYWTIRQQLKKQWRRNYHRHCLRVTP